MKELLQLVEVVRRLRDPDGGCPWDLEQSFETIAPLTIEEAYEVADAIERKDYNDLKNELGDLLLQVVFQTQLANEQGLFGFSEVAAAITNKLVRRHPHVFASTEVENADEVLSNWEDIKASERKEKLQTGVLDDVALSLPALLRAQKLQKRAARVGMDWGNAQQALAKIVEEAGELQELFDEKQASNERLNDEMGDLLFSCVNLARKLKLESEESLRTANSKFESRIRAMEKEAKLQGTSLAALNAEQLDELWGQVKRQ